jgi:hypothetical protein
VAHGKITYEAVAEAFGKPYVPALEVIAAHPA